MPSTEFATSSLTLLSLSLDENHSLLLSVSPWVLGGLIVLGLVILGFYRWSGRLRGPNFEIDQAEVGLGPGTISFKPNIRDQQIAYAIWVELSTRKIGLPIDLDHDVIWEIYDSWHHFFSVTRELIKDIPVNKVKNVSTQKVINLSIDVLNKGLRPHLTAWQARFRHWYERELGKANGEIDPQSLQAQYPKFQDLKADLLIVNNRLIKYREKMRELVLGVSN